MTGFSETRRQSVHVAMGGFAILLRWLSWWQAVALAAAALLFNVLVLPRLAGNLLRPGDRARVLHGIVFYPVAVLGLLLVFPQRPDIAAAAWGILAAGDGVATVVGRRLGGPRWPWHPVKTLAGTGAFIVAGALCGIALAWWCAPAATPHPSRWFTLAAPVVAAVAAAFVETIPVSLDDNLSVAAAAGSVLWIAAHVRPTGDIAWGVLAVRIPAALLLNAAVAAAGVRARTVSWSGAIVGAIIGIVIFTTTGWQGWLLLLITFVAASVSSRMGLARKQQLGIAEARGGRRGAGNAIANTGVAAIASALVVAGRAPDAACLALAAALVAGGSDTIASEIGKAWGRRAYSVLTLRRVPPGTSGAMSLEGTAAGVAGAVALAAVAVAVSIVPAASLPVVVVAAIVGSLVESVSGATFEERGVLNNDVLNFINTAAAALVAIALAAA